MIWMRRRRPGLGEQFATFESSKSAPRDECLLLLNSEIPWPSSQARLAGPAFVARGAGGKTIKLIESTQRLASDRPARNVCGPERSPDLIGPNQVAGSFISWRPFDQLDDDGGDHDHEDKFLRLSRSFGLIRPPSADPSPA